MKTNSDHSLDKPKTCEDSGRLKQQVILTDIQQAKSIGLAFWLSSCVSATIGISLVIDPQSLVEILLLISSIVMSVTLISIFLEMTLQLLNYLILSNGKVSHTTYE